MKISFFVPTRPVPKARPRLHAKLDYKTFNVRKFVYTPKKTRDAEDEIKQVARLFCKIKATTPVSVAMVFTYKTPKSTVLQVPRGDIDNLVKTVLDALNGIAYDDDTLVFSISAKKQFDERDGIFVTLAY